MRSTIRPLPRVALRRLATLVVILLVGVLLVDTGTASALLPIRPDGRVRLVGDVGWIGNNVYNRTGAGQTRVTSVTPGGSADFEVSIQNDGRAGSFRVRGTGGTATFPTTYRYNGTDVTSRVVAGTFTLANLARGASRRLSVRIRVAPTAPYAASRTARVTATSTADPTKKDAVQARVTVGDVTPPAIDLRTPAVGADYARNQVVPADYSCTDGPGGAGIASCTGTVPDGQAVDTTTLGSHQFSVTATDNAGNSVQVGRPYQVHDGTQPVVDLRTPADGQSVALGATVLADYSCTDEPGGSGLQSCTGTVPDGQAIDTATVGAHLFTVTATDNAANTANRAHWYQVEDVTAPTVDLRTPPDGAVYEQDQAVTGDFSCSDEPGGSGIATCTGTWPDGDLIETATLGPHTFTVTATDGAGHTTQVSHGYTVIPTNHAPEFPTPTTVESSNHYQYDGYGRLIGVTTDITVSACVDPDGDPLTYEWTATNGSITGNGTSASWTRLLIGGRVQPGDVTVVCRDPDGASDSVLIRYS